MIYDTYELGPRLYEPVPKFRLPDHNQKIQSLDGMMGEKGILLGFIGDIWQPASVRRILWLQRHVTRFTQTGIPVSLVIRDTPHTLYGFRVSSPLPVPFPLLADESGEVHKEYVMDRHPGLLLVDSFGLLREKWLMPDDNIWPALKEIVDSMQILQSA